MDWKYILFDLDGTLTDSCEGIINCVKYALEAFGKPVPSEAELMCFIGPPLVESFQIFSGMNEKEAVAATEKYRERYGTVGLFENALYEGIEGVLAGLKTKGYKIALATSKPEKYSVQILEHFDIQKYFDEIVGSTLDGKRNAKADVIREVFNRMQITPEMKEQVLMVGDRKHDILGAKECGIASLGVYYGFAPENELEECGADYIIHEVKELYSFFHI